MRIVTKAQIAALAPNPAAMENGRKISQKGGFVRLQRSEDDTFYMGECKGSGKSNYITSADFIEEASPVFRCSCPSRQFPCKHSLALLFEMMQEKQFSVCEIPEDIQKKREKKQAREEKAEEKKDKTERKAKSETSGAKAAKSAKTKKIRKQLEGLDFAEKMVADFMNAGLGAMGGAQVKSYMELAKQLGDYYLPGPQQMIHQMILEITLFQQDGKEVHYDKAIEVLERLWSLIKKSRQYLSEKLENGQMDPDNNMLYEELGGIWKLSELEQIGRSVKNREFIQMAFWVTEDQAGKQYIDTGCWADIEDGAIYMTYNYRPFKVLKYVKQEDTVFGVVQAESAGCYPGEGNVRIRWDRANIREMTKRDLDRLRSLALKGIAEEAKAMKNLLKNPLSDQMIMRLIAFSEIGHTMRAKEKEEEFLVLTAENKDTIMLGDKEGMEPTTEHLRLLPDASLLEHQVMLAGFYYEKEKRRLMAQPLSILTDETIVRLLY